MSASKSAIRTFGWLTRLNVGWLTLLIVGCVPRSGPPVKNPTPAKVEMVPHESELATISLTPEARTRLGIVTVAMEERTVSPRRVFGGEVMVPSGRSIAVVAPVAGVVSQPVDSAFPVPGTKVAAGTSILMLTPILSPERDVPTPAEQFQMAGARATLLAAQVTAQGDIDRGQAEVEAARIAVGRSQRLLADRAGSQRAVDDAQAQWNIASSVLSAARDRHSQLTKLLTSLDRPSENEEASNLTMRAPVDGIIRNVNVSNGQQVIGGSLLFEVLDRKVVWIRVPVFVDLLPTLQSDANGKIVSLEGKTFDGTNEPSSSKTPAIPIDAPPTADANTSSADLYFSIDNEHLGLRPGQRVGLELPLAGAKQALVVPGSAIVYDIYGGTWVYIEVSENRFERRRTNVRWFDEDMAILQSGPAIGSKIVVAGAAELYGTEFGGGK